MNNREIENEMIDVNKQFTEFLKTKGIKARFKLVVSNIKDNTKAQHKIDVANFKQVKKESRENNKEFVELLETKGLKEKFHVIIEGFKNSAKDNTDKSKPKEIQKVIKQKINNPIYSINGVSNYTLEDLSKEFNNFLRLKGLGSQYTVIVKAE